MIIVIIVIAVIAICIISSIIVDANIDISTTKIKLRNMQKHNQFCSNCKYHSINGNCNSDIYKNVCELTRENCIDPVTGKITSTGVRYCADNVGNLFTCKWTEC